MELSDKLTVLSGVGDVVARKFTSLGINSVEELLTYYPRKYNDFSQVVPINKTKPGAVTIKAKLPMQSQTS